MKRKKIAFTECRHSEERYFVREEYERAPIQFILIYRCRLRRKNAEPPVKARDFQRKIPEVGEMSQWNHR